MVALKVINPELLSDPIALERFRGKARAAACLSHPNVVTVYDAETAGEGHFLVMEYVTGTDLARLVAKCGPLPVAAACDSSPRQLWGWNTPTDTAWSIATSRQGI